ncbi:hypothetical protein FISHEDRAFT_45614, partial [Fistulina hepatica ATCC 64428]
MATNTGGVAFVLNKGTTNIEGVRQYELEPGRALMLAIPWHGNKVMNMLTLYAPAGNMAENEAFWRRITNKIESSGNIPEPDVVLTDANVVEDEKDRLPARSDPPSAVGAYREFMRRFGLVDGWRTLNPDKQGYTFKSSANGSQARLDKILIKENKVNTSRQWQSNWQGKMSDHKLASVEIVDVEAPFRGPGRWQLPKHLAENERVIKMACEAGDKFFAKVNDLQNMGRTEERNVQLLFKEMKDEIAQKARQIAKILVPRLDEKIAKKESVKEKILQNQTMAEEDKKDSAGMLEEE